MDSDTVYNKSDSDQVNSLLSKSAYTNPERKKELVRLLKEQYDLLWEAGNILEQKAWSLLGAVTAIIGVVAAIAVNSLETVHLPFIVFLALIIITYISFYCQIYKAIEPQKYTMVPGTGAERTTRENFLYKYVFQAADDDTFYEALLIDYLGSSEKLGVLDKLEIINKKKASHVRSASVHLPIILILLVSLSASIML